MASETVTDTAQAPAAEAEVLAPAVAATAEAGEVAAAEAAPAKVRKPRKPRAVAAKAPNAPKAPKVDRARPAKAVKPAKAAAKTSPKLRAAKASGPFQTLKDTIMATKTTDFTATIKNAMGEAQAKAKEGFAKGSELVAEATQFAKGNVEAVVESGKILAEGSRKIGEGLVAEAKDAFETLNADMQQLAAVKSPTDLVKLQGDIARRNLEQAIAFTSKSSEAWMKLAGEAFAPLTGRVTLAVEKIKKAA